MAEETTIPKNPALLPDEDYQFLRSEGLRYIEELGSSLWTDYNAHDPGITILEALCYSITELGYRASLPIQDLLTDANGQIGASQVLFTPKNILTQAPLTINDYRKLLVDLDGVHNAWLYTDDVYTANEVTQPAGEVPIFADCKADKLTYTTTPHPVYLSGLYKVLLDLDDDLLVGSLNTGNIQVLNPASATLKAGEISFTLLLPAWNSEVVNADLLKAKEDSLANVSATITADGANYVFKAQFSFEVEGDATVHAASLEGNLIIDLKPSGKQLTQPDMEAFFSPAFTLEVINLYLYKIKKGKNIVQAAVKKLHESRNLCEDFVSVDTVPDEEIAICCDIEVTPETDMEQVQADVFFAIEQYLNPSPDFYLLKDLLSKGYTTSEIFEGPVLTHGFIDTEELEQTMLREMIYASDIISLVMDIKGVQAVRSFRITKWGKDGRPVATQTGKAWCMPVTPLHKPLLSETRSKIVFYKNAFPYLPGLAEVRDTLRWLRAVNARNKLVGHTDDVPVPRGQFVPLDEYTSIQNLFPVTYGIGTAGLPQNATEQRKAQAKQLKAYLLFYDQLMADFFSQLQKAKTLFSTGAVTSTYYAQYLNEINGIDAIYTKDITSNALLEAVLNNQDATAATPNEWQQLYEPNAIFTDRRSRFLNHLMARFAESFNDYVLLMYSLDYEQQTETPIDAATITDSKMAFLQSYPQVSYERAKAFNYYPQLPAPAPQNFTVDDSKLWNTNNVSGLENKVGRLAGIQTILRRFLYCFTMADIVATSEVPATYRFVFTNAEGNAITSVDTFNSEGDAMAAVTPFLAEAAVAEQYEIEASGGGQRIVIKGAADNVLAASNPFADEATATAAKDTFFALFNTACEPEGMHLIEHILLRPRNNIFVLPPVCLQPDCDFCGEQDLFSFRMSVVLPYWPNHFSSSAFRDYFEQLVQQEAPAHTTVKVCWLGNAAMRQLEIAYKAWLTALANYAADKATINALQLANDALVNILFYLHSQHPVATLHDCDESSNTNPVMLGRTILGSFKTE